MEPVRNVISEDLTFSPVDVLRLIIQAELAKERKAMKLESELYTIYQITQIYLSETLYDQDWRLYLTKIWESVVPSPSSQLVVGDSVIDSGLGRYPTKSVVFNRARSFYTAIAEAIQSEEKLPNLESCLVGVKYGSQFNMLQRLRLRDDYNIRRGQVRIVKMDMPRVREVRRTLSNEAQPFHPASSSGEGTSSPATLNDHLSSHQQQIGDRLYVKVHALRPLLAPKITGMQEEWPGDGAEDNSPLFYQPGKKGFYSPRMGKPTAERTNAFRNGGRFIGLCLLQNELCPITLNRHVLKFILDRPIRFHDMALFDNFMYESFRQLILEAESKDPERVFSGADLTFSLDLSPEEGGRTVELIPGGRNIEVTEHNVYDYVKKYVEYRMVRSQYKALEELRSGVNDVIPTTSLEGLTAEDLRLLMNGVGEINVNTLMSYTSFNDENGETGDKLSRFKKWFWQMIEKMSNLERQDLLYFWTGSPAPPASEDGFQPMPTATIRPAKMTLICLQETHASPGLMYRSIHPGISCVAKCY